MSLDKLEQLEWQFNEMNKNFWKIEWTLENIERLLSIAVWMNETVITHKEKHKISEKRVDKIDEKISKMQENINWINLKIAMVSWAWTVVIFAISKL